ncbi:MAG: hypothetical protein JNN15_13540, partial [Blastocatellia bacterium]|nr:hypothetical protein [Blastocatellia bacterium]
MLKTIAKQLLSILMMVAGGFLILQLTGQAEKRDTTEEIPPEGGTDFALFSRKVYSTKDRPKFTLSYRDLDHIDFRVYKIEKPTEFFARLRNLHQSGEQDSSTLARKVSALEKFSNWKFKTLQALKTFVRAQLSKKARVAVQKSLYKNDGSVPRRAPLNHADFTAIPLLNSYGLVESWRERVPRLTYSDYSTIPLATQEPGVYLVEAAHEKLRAYTLVFVTDLGIVTKSWNQSIVAYTINRVTGEPVAGTTVEMLTPIGDGEVPEDIKKPIRTSHARSQSDKDGMWKATLPEGYTSEGTLLVAYGKLAGKEHFVAADTGRNLGIYGYGQGEEGSETTRTYIYTDRPVYRPGQTIYYKAILRRDTATGFQLPQISSVPISVRDPEGKNLYQTTATVNSTGTTTGSIQLSNEAALGSYSLQVGDGDFSSYFYFSVEEYKKPEYKVSVNFKERRVVIGSRVTATITGKYYFGAPVSNASVKYYIYRERYTPPWQEEDSEEENFQFSDDESYYSYDNEFISEGEGKLDKEGRLDISFDTAPPKATIDEKDSYLLGYDYRYRVDATITDSARRDITESGSIIVSNGKFTLSVATQQYLYSPNELVKMVVTSKDYDGKPVSTPIRVKFVRSEWQEKNGQWERNTKTVGETTAQTDQTGTANVEMKASSVGDIEIIATAQDEGRTVYAPVEYFWVSDDLSNEDYYMRSSTAIKMIPDKKSYKSGDEARVLLSIPDSDTHIIVSLEGKTLIKSWHIVAKGKTAVVRVKLDRSIVPSGVPNVYLSATYVKNGQLHTGAHSLNVPPKEKMLKVEVFADKPQYQPRETVTYTITTRDLSGTPAPAEVSLGVVDEAIYAIAGESAPDIQSFFYQRISNYVYTGFSADYDFSGYSSQKAWDLAKRSKQKDRKPFAALKPDPKNDVRKNFKDTAFWSAIVTTDANGKAEVKVELPDNLTTWRATARAVTADTRVGSTVEKILARKNLLVRLAIPRFFLEGDEVTVSAIVHNYLKSKQTTEISLQTNGIDITSGNATTSSTIEPNGEVRVDWKVKATNVGQAVLTAKAKASAESDGVEFTVPINPHGRRIGHGEAVTLVDNDAEGTLKTNIGIDASPGSRKLRVDVASSISGTAFGALDYLTSYPYGCVEQTMSSFLPNIIVTRAMKETNGAVTVSDPELSKKVEKGLRKLYDYQHQDGGWGWWKEDATDLYMTAHVVAGLGQASKAGYLIDQQVLNRGRAWIAQELDRNRSWKDPIGLDDRVFLLYALVTSGRESATRVESLAGQAQKLPPLSQALLALSLDEVGNRNSAIDVVKKLEATASGNEQESYWPSKRKLFVDYEDDVSVEATSFAVKALARLQPQSPVLLKAARWLVNHRTNGHYWATTKQTAFAIDALVDYSRASGELQGEYDWEVYINGQQYSTGHISTSDVRAGKSFSIELKPNEIRNGVNEVKVVKRGAGTLCASLTSLYFTREANVKAAGSEALSIGRDYFKLSLEVDKDNRPILKPVPFDGNAKSGDLILVRLTLDGKPAKYLMLEDLFPSGTEPFVNENQLPGTLPAIEGANYG